MRELFILIAHLLVTLAKLTRPGGLGAVTAESLAVKQQLLIMKRARRRDVARRYPLLPCNRADRSSRIPVLALRI